MAPTCRCTCTVASSRLTHPSSVQHRHVLHTAELRRTQGAARLELSRRFSGAAAAGGTDASGRSHERCTNPPASSPPPSRPPAPAAAPCPSGCTPCSREGEQAVVGSGLSNRRCLFDPPHAPTLSFPFTKTCTHSLPARLLASICAAALSMLVMLLTCGKTRTCGAQQRGESEGEHTRCAGNVRASPDCRQQPVPAQRTHRAPALADLGVAPQARARGQRLRREDVENGGRQLFGGEQCSAVQRAAVRWALGYLSTGCTARDSGVAHAQQPNSRARCPAPPAGLHPHSGPPSPR